MTALLDHQKLRQALFDRQISQEVFAELIGISDRYVRCISAKDSNVSIRIFQKICEMLDCPMESLLIFHKDKE